LKGKYGKAGRKGWKKGRGGESEIVDGLAFLSYGNSMSSAKGFPNSFGAVS